MLFNSWQFLLIFLPMALLIHWATERHQPQLRLPVLLLLSLIFYSYWDYRFLPLILLSIVINWSLAKAFVRTHRSSLVAFAITINIAVLGIFKYTGFAISILAPVVELPASPLADLALPLGISFFTFHHVMYLTDLSAGKAPQFPFVKYGLYIAFFPQVLAGPLVRWSEIMHQLDERPYQRADAVDRLAQGIFLLSIGLGKKLLISDPLSKVADPIFFATTRVVHPSFLDAWQAALAFTFQIYFDFSGYTDMAMGIALMFGIALPQNFNAPYRAINLQDFWRRWHMTLSRFLRDYLYIPLGGNQHGLTIQIAALLATMTLGGLWHGAGVNFILWGALHGIALCWILLWSRLGLSIAPLIAWLLTFAFVVMTWVPFRAQTYESALLMWKGMLGFYEFDHRFSSSSFWSAIAVGLAVSTLGPTSWTLADRAQSFLPASLAIGLILAFSLLVLAAGGSYQFIYFQF
jgi:alginate O-acetyltransferase complex protein AlgI